jgi:hypothetical protein
VSQDRIESLSRSLANATSRREVLRLFGVGVAGTAIGTAGLREVGAKKKGDSGNNPLENIAFSGTDENGNPVSALFDVRKFAERDGEIVALGKLTGTLEKNGKSHQFTKGNVAIPVSILDAGSGTVSAQQLECEVLHLELGPLDLNLLGLQVHLDQVVLDITADPTGGILGQLLCSLAGGGPLAQLISLLNQILAILQGL